MSEGIIAEHRIPAGSVRILLARPEDREKLIRFYTGLDRETIYYRFLHPVKDFTRHVDMMLGPLNRYGFVLMAVLGDEIIGVGELFAKNRKIGEIAVTVHPNYRRQGLGTRLAAALALEAYKRGIEIIEAYISSENTPARRIAEKLGLTMKYVGMGVFRIRVKLDQVYDKAAKLLGLGEAIQAREE